jgi:plastocyanin
MAFYFEEDPGTPNPTIVLRPGETVRIVLRNDERGILHDFAVPALAADLDPLAWRERGAVTITAPRQPGAYEYVCRPHRPMMRGMIVVPGIRDQGSG